MNDWEYKPAGDFGLDPAQGLRSVRREAGLIASITQAAWQARSEAVFARLPSAGDSRQGASSAGAAVCPDCQSWQSSRRAGARGNASTAAAASRISDRRRAMSFSKRPVASIFAAMMLNALPMWRKRCGSHAMQDLRVRLIGDPAIYILFPEGTRSRDGKIGTVQTWTRDDRCGVGCAGRAVLFARNACGIATRPQMAWNRRPSP